MRLKNLKTKTVCFLFVIALFLQSCSVYKRPSVTLDEAITADRKVLVVKTNNTKLKFIRIEQIDGIYYGRLKTKGKIEKIPLTESDLKTIRVLDKTATTIGNVAIVVGSLGVVLLVIAAIELSDLGDDWGDWGY
jgi:PBP1b-binding outer membrane lipoprotein LpoB